MVCGPEPAASFSSLVLGARCGVFLFAGGQKKVTPNFAVQFTDVDRKTKYFTAHVFDKTSHKLNQAEMTLTLNKRIRDA